MKITLRPFARVPLTSSTLKAALVPSVTAALGPTSLIVTGGTSVIVVVISGGETSETKSLRVTLNVSADSVSRSALTGTDSAAIPVPVLRSLAAVATARIRPVVGSTLMFFSTIPADACSEVLASDARSVKIFVGFEPLPLN